MPGNADGLGDALSAEEEEENEAGSADGQAEASTEKRRKPTRRAGRRVRHRLKLGSKANEEASSLQRPDPAGKVATSASGSDHQALGTDTSPKLPPEAAASPAKTPTRRGGRPPRKSALVAAATVSPLCGQATTPDTAGLGLNSAQTPPAAADAATPALGCSAASPTMMPAAGAAASQVQASDSDELVGKRVLLTGLVRTTEFNGEWGRVEAFDAELQRYTVCVLLESGPPVLAKLRRENLIAPKTVALMFDEDGTEKATPKAAFAGAGKSVLSLDELVAPTTPSPVAPVLPFGAVPTPSTTVPSAPSPIGMVLPSPGTLPGPSTGALPAPSPGPPATSVSKSPSMAAPSSKSSLSKPAPKISQTPPLNGEQRSSACVSTASTKPSAGLEVWVSLAGDGQGDSKHNGSVTKGKAEPWHPTLRHKQ
eukprot:gnl/TRDRNA2_/TRDRNA2_89271_c0_seq1.p1 gnl/TRDRNA2_/TRDRNA2_89271_c0~~gnl/TRDRNA2_/TRDRNA2_89271_c0_seq1.p1  ORF type:complete len:498 (+),score=91.30 gnl/TRDRNA2_/TRDRNA2_89271_c0_seq1:221-1495(+)